MAYPDKPKQDSGVLHALFEKAETHGYLTSADIADAYPRGEGTQEQLHKIHNFLRRRGIEVLADPEEDELNASDESESSLINETPWTEDSVEIYLKEMSRVPLLTLQEEVQLAQRIEKGHAAQEKLYRLPLPVDKAEERELANQIEDGQRAREHIIKANTRLVVSIAKKYVGRGVPFLDLIQEGNLGLMKAVEKFEYRRGFRFSTYATWWIRQTISRSVADQGRTIRLPVHMSDRIQRLYRASHQLEQSLGRLPTTQELARELELPVSKVQWLLQISWVPLSLESPVGDEEDSELGMFVEDETSPTPFQAAYQTMLHDRLNEVLATLSPREARILRLRFGLDDEQPYTLEEVGAKFGLTRERIRQIEGKALRRLRHPRRARQLREYL